jgi:hypothetical protein
MPPIERSLRDSSRTDIRLALTNTTPRREERIPSKLAKSRVSYHAASMWGCAIFSCLQEFSDPAAWFCRQGPPVSHTKTLGATVQNRPAISEAQESNFQEDQIKTRAK